MNDVYYELLREICDEDGIQITFLSDNWVVLLEKSGIRKFIVGYKFGLNLASAALVADDKYATFEVLKRAGLPVIEHKLLYEPENHRLHVQGRNTLQYIEQYFHQNHGHIVIKPNNGKTGENVYQVTAMDQIPEILPKAFHQCYSASMCPFYEIKYEYRTILLDGIEQIMYQKVRGDDWRFNLQHGARANQFIAEQVRAKLLTLARRAAETLGLRFCSVDIIQTNDNQLLVLEVNSGVMVEKYLTQHPDERPTVKAMYQAAIRKMFESQ